MKLITFLGLVVLVTTVSAVALRKRQHEPKGAIQSPKDVVEYLDSILQSRFLEIDDRFGLARIELLPGHDGARMNIGVKVNEKESWKAIIDSQFDFEIGFVHTARKPAITRRKYDGSTETFDADRALKYRDSRLDKDGLLMTRIFRSVTLRGRKTEDLEKHEWLDQATSMMAQVARGKSMNVKIDSQLVAYRPILASRLQCLTCHTQSKLGDTLGALAYQVFPKPAVSQSAKKP